MRRNTPNWAKPRHRRVQRWPQPSLHFALRAMAVGRVLDASPHPLPPQPLPPQPTLHMSVLTQRPAGFGHSAALRHAKLERTS